jgi:OOP family OmpA-OmpF porin
MMTFVTRIAIAALALSMVTGAHAQSGDWYIAPSIIYADDDPDRAVEAGVVGFQVNLGRIMSEHWSLEGSLGYNDWESWLAPPTQRYPDQFAIDLSANALYSFNRNKTFAPYLMAGIGYLAVDRTPGSAENNPSFTAGVGFDWRMGQSNFSIRGEARYRYAYDMCSADCQSRLDFIAGIGLQYQFGGEPAIPAPDSDTDLDGVLDMWDECPDTPRGTQVSSSGCPLLDRDRDSDGDRVPDGDDDCPNTPVGAAVNNRGCSLDSDRDGVPTGEDRCPGSRPNAIVDMYGCENDSDGDTVVDHRDSCPQTPAGARVDIYGCEIEDIIYLPGLNFQTGKDIILPGAEYVLRDAAATLNKHPDLRIEVAGHTDDVGPGDINYSLSERRAVTVRDFLIRYGVDESRITAVGYGEAQPIADNSTAEGRATNRRVELRVLN